jgi:dTDP-L-rhamnose 4-epimerase
MTASRTGDVLVTGGAGFVGSAISRACASSDVRWVAIDSLNERIHESQERPARLSPHAELVIGDILDERVWDRVLDGWRPQTVVHLAAETDTGLSLTFPSRFTRVNLDGTALMLEALARHDAIPARIVLASSRAVYGEGTWRDDRDGVERSRPLRTRRDLVQRRWDFPDATPVASRAGETREAPTNVYGVTKHGQEGLLSAWCGAHGVDLTTLRLQNVYGPGQSLINPYTGILALFVRIAANGEKIPVYEDGEMLRDFVHIDDVTAAFANVMMGEDAGTRTFDIGTGQAVSVIEIARLIASTLDAPDPVVTGDFRDGDIRHAWCTIDDAVRELGWMPHIDWRQGVADYARWYVDRREGS